jgi:hypothetical protein
MAWRYRMVRRFRRQVLMGARNPVERYTPARHQWLARLNREPLVQRRGSVVGFQCMRLGWTQWLYVLDEEPRKHTTDPLGAIPRWRVVGETLTPAGVRMLNVWTKQHGRA